MSDHPTFTQRVVAHFLSHPGEWVDAEVLMRIGGRYAFRTRVSDARKQLGVIENRQRKVREPDGRAYVVSEYRYVPTRLPFDAPAPAVAADAPNRG